VADKIFFMNDRLALPETAASGRRPQGCGRIMRQYQGEVERRDRAQPGRLCDQQETRLHRRRYHFLGDHKGEKRIRDAVMSFRLVPPAG